MLTLSNYNVSIYEESTFYQDSIPRHDNSFATLRAHLPHGLAAETGR